MGDDNNRNMEAFEDSQSDKCSSTSSQNEAQDLRANLQDLHENDFENPCPRLRAWLHRQSGRIQKLKMSYKSNMQIEVNVGCEKMTQTYEEEVRARNNQCLEALKEAVQETNKAAKNCKASFNQGIVKQYIEMFRKSHKTLMEERKIVEKDFADAMKLCVALDESCGQEKPFEVMQEEISQRFAAIQDLLNKMPAARDAYVSHVRERRQLDKSLAELETLKIILRDSGERTATLAAEEESLDAALVAEEKSFETKLASVKQMSKYLAINENTLAEMEAKVQSLDARNTEKRRYEGTLEETKTFHEEEIKGKEEILQQAVEYKEKLQAMEDDNENLEGMMRDYLKGKKQGIEGDLKAMKEEVAELEKQYAIVDERKKKLDDLELILQVSVLNNKRNSDCLDDFSVSSQSGEEVYKSPRLETPNRTDRDSP